ncbi:efflux RND transporter periplasmic adaptor subunit [Solilutibacter silvestris]|uniref:RND efflux transport protein n=1 Tax=Solilutibacter silvestris TaxID=1645665 RepID=A0A2K1Q275_9GAMM|nr:efflux RND transporter periplasmic adaptor subunit [Lysobacter silvestris]PNS09134.1 RND efflux transport protein [Lysobacter silvestris]
MNTNADLLSQLRIDRSAPPPRRSLRWLWITLAIIAALAIFAIIGWMVFARSRVIEVQTATVTAMGGSGNQSASVLDATGYVVARRIATVSAKVTGKLLDVRIQEGQHIEEGQIIATLEPVDANEAKVLATAQAHAAQSQAGSLQAQLVDAETNVKRLAPLMQQKLVSQAQYTQAVAARDSLRAQLASANASAQAAQAQLTIAGTGVDNTIIRAPFKGVVIAKAAQPGEIVSPFSAGGGFTRTGIGTIVDMDSLEVEVDVGEAYIGRVQPGMPVEATLNAYPDWKIPAHVIAIIPTADRGKATVKVRVALDKKDDRIVPDMGVSVSFLEKARPADQPAPKGVRAPTAAIVQRDGKDVAFVVGDGGKVAMHELTVAGKIGNDAKQVVSGLSAGDTVVLQPPAELKDGGKVKDAAAKSE